MKRLILLFTILPALFITQSVLAQEMQTLFDSDVTHGGFGAPVIKISGVNGTPGVWVGGQGGWLINLEGKHSISLGGGGYGLVTEHRVPEPDFSDSEDEYYALNGYGGFIIEYTHNPRKLVHFSLSSLIGGGELMTRNQQYTELDDHHDPYFVLEPAANVELNITDFFRISGGISYRYTRGINSAGFNDDDFSGINGNLSFKFGKF